MQNRVLADIKVLKDAISNRKLVVFAGAGISVDAGVPAWGKLIDEFKKDISVPDSENDYLKVAQMYYNERQEKEYIDKIRNVLGANNAIFNGIHRGIFDLKPEHVITTNYDDLLEQVVSAEALPYSIVRDDRDFPYSFGSNLLVKMHGDINSVDMVLKEDDYLEYSNKHPLVESFIKSVFASKVVLFIGYSFSDINLKAIVQTVRNILGNNFQMAYLFSASDHIHDSQRQYLKRKGINVISYSDGFSINNKNSEAGILNYFSEYVSSIKNDLNSYDEECLKLSNQGKVLYDFLIFLSKYSFFKEGLQKENIVDQMYMSLNRFSDIKCIPSRYLVSLYPFRSIGEEITYHNIYRYTFECKNKEINNLFANDLDFIDNKMLIKDSNEIALNKLNDVVKKLNSSLVWNIKGAGYNPVGGEPYKNVCIDIRNNKDFGNAINDYIYLRFDKCLTVIANMSVTQTSNIDDDMEFCYLNYKLGNFKQCLGILEEVADKAWKSEKYIAYFMAKSNMKTLHNLLNYASDIDDEQKNDLLSKINAFELDDLVAKLAKLDEDQRDFIIKIRDKYFNRVFEGGVEEQIENINKVFWLYYGANGIELAPLYHVELEDQLLKYFFYLTNNYIVYDEYSDFRSLCQKAVEALIISYSLPNDYRQKVVNFSTFILLIIIHYCDNDKLIEKMKHVKIYSLPVNESSSKDIVGVINNFLLANHTISKAFSYVAFDSNAQLNNYYLIDVCVKVFNNSLFVLSSIDISEECAIEIFANLNSFLLNINHNKRFRLIKSLIGLIKKQGKYCKWDTFCALIKLVSESSVVRYEVEDFYSAVHKVYVEKFAHKKISEIKMLGNILDDKDDSHVVSLSLVYLWNMSNSKIKSVIKRRIINRLEKDFDGILFQFSCSFGILKPESYLEAYINENVKYSPQNMNFRNGMNRGRAAFFPNIISYLDAHNIDKKIMLNESVEYSDFQMFMIQPETFDFNKFNPEWLMIIYDEKIIANINSIHNIGSYVVEYIKENNGNRELKKNVDKLSEIYFKILV